MSTSNKNNGKTSLISQRVVIAGATGYLGRFLVSEYQRRGWQVAAIVRNKERAKSIFHQEEENQNNVVEIIEAEVTKPETLQGVLSSADLVISAVGITRQRDGLTYRDVDYQANKNLLEEAIATKLPHFAYIHVLQGESMAHLTAIRAKQDFVHQLEKAFRDGRLEHATVIAPSGFFSDMKDFLDMAQTGRAYLFGDGSTRINPIHGADLATATADAIQAKTLRLNVGGPDIFTHRQLAELAFQTLQKPARITLVWDWIRTFLIQSLPWLSPMTVWGPAQFFLTAMGQDMVGDCHGTHHLSDFFAQVVKDDDEKH